MDEKQEFLAPGEDVDETLVTPRFDEVEAGTARPVVPFAEVASVADDVDDVPAYVPHAGAPAAYVARPTPRRSWTLASVIVLSALVGTLLGGAGLRYYQQRQRAAAAAAEPSTPAQTEAAQPAQAQPFIEDNQAAVLPATIVEDPGDTPGDTDAATASVVTASTSRTDAAAVDDKRDDATKPVKSSDKERDDESTKKKDDRKKEDDDRDTKPDKDKTPAPRRVDVITAPPPAAVGVQVGQSEGAEAESRPSARDRDEIIEERRRRRQERRERRARERDVDRVRGIFEGQP